MAERSVADVLEQVVATLEEIRNAQHPQAVSFEECCRRLHLGLRTGERLYAEGSFPVPELPRLGVGRGRRAYSTHEIDRYLEEASIPDSMRQVKRRRRKLRVVSR